MLFVPSNGELSTAMSQQRSYLLPFTESKRLLVLQIA